MADTQTNQSGAGKGSDGNGGAQRSQSRAVATQESTGKEGRAMARTGSRQIASAADQIQAVMRVAS